ncbi:hypothetical protein B0H12DRAFT_1240021 [Mycena haematopus]|nr:hypothetical protein B0H12DRAFT_1240021 [Mycena haematopus]
MSANMNPAVAIMQLKVIVAFALALATHAGALILERQVQECCIPINYPCDPTMVVPPPPLQAGCCKPYVCIPDPAAPQYGRCLPPPA